MIWSAMKTEPANLGLASLFQDMGDASLALQLTQCALQLPLVAQAVHVLQNPNAFGIVAKADLLPASYEGFRARRLKSSWDLPSKPSPGTLRYKHHVEVRTYSSTFRPYNLAYVFSKHTVVYVLMKIRTWLGKVAEAEDKAWELGKEPEYPPFPDVRQEVKAGLYGGLRDLIVITTRRFYEHLAVAYLEPRWAWKLLKDYRASIRRKAARHPALGLAPRLLMYSRTACRSLSLYLAADFTVSVAELSVHVSLSKRPTRKKLRFWLVGTACHATRCSIALVADGIGAAIGGAIRPEGGAYIGYWLVDLGASAALDSFVLNPIFNYERELLWRPDVEGLDMGAMVPGPSTSSG